jgi:hypothetical protein
MFSKSKNKFFLTTLTLFCLSNFSIIAPLSDQAILSTYQGANGPWRYLEYLFVIKPENQLKHFTDNCFSFVGTIGGLLIAKSYFTAQNKVKSNDKSVENNEFTLIIKDDPARNFLMTISVVIAGKTAYDSLTSYIKKQISHQTVTDFLKKWNTHRSHVPTSLVEYFDELALTYESKGSKYFTSSFVAEVFELIQHHLEHHFENRYKQAEKRKNNPIETFKNCTEVWKNLG